MNEANAKQIVIIVDGVRFTLDYTDADTQLLEEIARIIKGLLKKIEQRAQQRARQLTT